jgi:S1-C subfamily serine protease
MQGRLIGVNTAIFSTSEGGGNVGVGFAIPSNMVKSIVEQLLKFGKVNRGMMGILVQTATPDIAKALGADVTSGAVITGIMPYSPAETAKLMVGDIIIKINDQAVQSYADVVNTLGLYPVGQPTTLTIIRGGKTQEIKAATADAKAARKKQVEVNPFLYGLVMQNIAIDTPDRGYIEGVHILDVKDFSPASTVGLSPGDIILSANQMPTKTVNDLKRIAQTSKGPLLLFVLHQRQSLFVVLQ